MYDFVICFFFIGILGMLFITPAKMCKGIKKIEFGSLTVRERLTAFVPIYNVASAEKVYTGKVSSIAVTSVAVVISSLLRVLVIFKFTDNLTFNVVSVVLVCGSLIAWIVCNMIFVYRVMNDADCVSFLKKLFYTIFFPLGQNFIGNYLPVLIQNVVTEEETF